MDVGTEVWVKSDESVWAPGVVLDCQEMLTTGDVKVKVADGSLVTRRYVVPRDDGAEGDGNDSEATAGGENEIFMRNARHDFASLACLIGLEYLHEPALLHALSERFAHDRIYTSIGDILLSVNPFKTLDLYSPTTITAYKDAMVARVLARTGGHGSVSDSEDASKALPPHVFAIAGKAFSGLLKREGKNQSILVSGESGSGKTESTKFLMTFLTSVGHDFAESADGCAQDGASGNDSDLEGEASDVAEIGKRILQTNPLLESFGNARTIRNDNSSRFGKFIKIQFDSRNQIVGAEIASYLLEKVRLIHQSAQERNFHIFYELLEGGDAELLSRLGLERGARYELLNSYGSAPRSGGATNGRRPVPSRRSSPLTAQYSKRFLQTVQAFDDTGVDADERLEIFEILAALLHLGNVTFETTTQQIGDSGDTEDAASVTVSSAEHLKQCASLLGMDEDKMASLLLSREITAGKDLVKLRLNAEQSLDTSRSFAKAIYGRLFSWLVTRLSDGINCRDDVAPHEEAGLKTIGILDIFGFESLEQNGFEQMCINYANERLQAQFNEFVFVKEQSIYVAEEIDWRSISYPSNAACLALFDEKPNGLFSLLDQECLIPKGSNQALSTKYYRFHAGVDVLTDSFAQPQLQQQTSNKYIPLLVTSFGRYLHSANNGNGKAETSAEQTVARKARDSVPFMASKMDRVKQQFVIHHFAGNVSYQMNQFLEKNQDSLPADACTLLTMSSNPIVVTIGTGEGMDDASDAGGQTGIGGSVLRNRSRTRSRSSALRAPSVSSQFRSQLDVLIDEIGRTEAHYIRCLKPNEDKKPNAFDRHRMVEQLRSVGVLEALRIARAGYSARLALDSFVDTFACYRSRLEKSGYGDPRSMTHRELCKSLLALLVDETNKEHNRRVTPVRTLLKAPDSKFNEFVRNYGVQLGRTIVFCKTGTYNSLFQLRLSMREHAVRRLQSVALGRHYRHRFVEMKKACTLIQTHVRGHQARRFVARLRHFHVRVAANKLQRCMRAALIRKHELDERIRVHNLRRYFANFRLGCSLSAQTMEDPIPIRQPLEPAQVESLGGVKSGDVDTDKLTSRQSTSSMDSESTSGTPGSDEEREETMRRDEKALAHDKSMKKRQDPLVGDDLHNEIERLQKLLVQQNARSVRRQRSSGRSRLSSTMLDTSTSRRHRSQRSVSLSGAEAFPELVSQGGETELATPQRSQSVYQVGEPADVATLTQRIEELDSKCRLLERLVSRSSAGFDDRSTMGGFYPPTRMPSVTAPPAPNRWDRNRYSFTASDGGIGYADYQFETAPNGGGSSGRGGVENLIWSIQQQMDVLRQSVATKAEEEAAAAAALESRHESHATSFASSRTARSSTGTSNGSSTYQPFDGPLQERDEEHPSLESPTRRNSDIRMGYNSAPNSFGGFASQMMMHPSPSELSYQEGQPRSAPGHLGGSSHPLSYGMPIVKWARSTECHECQEPFTLFVRRHHCRVCGHSFCHEHSSRRVSIYGMGFDDEPVRVCDPCFADYHSGGSEFYPPGAQPPPHVRIRTPSMLSASGHAPYPHPGYPQPPNPYYYQQPPPPHHHAALHPHHPQHSLPQRFPSASSYFGDAMSSSPRSSSHVSAA